MRRSASTLSGPPHALADTPQFIMGPDVQRLEEELSRALPTDSGLTRDQPDSVVSYLGNVLQ